MMRALVTVGLVSMFHLKADGGTALWAGGRGGSERHHRLPLQCVPRPFVPRARKAQEIRKDVPR
jgi:hypothetical protein